MKTLKDFIVESSSLVSNLLTNIVTDLDNTTKIKRIIKSTFPDTKFSKDDVENIIDILWLWEGYMESCSDPDLENIVYLEKIDQKLLLDFFEKYSDMVDERANKEIYGLDETLCNVAKEVFKKLVSKITKLKF